MDERTDITDRPLFPSDTSNNQSINCRWNFAEFQVDRGKEIPDLLQNQVISTQLQTDFGFLVRI